MLDTTAELLVNIVVKTHMLTPALTAKQRYIGFAVRPRLCWALVTILLLKPPDG